MEIYRDLNASAEIFALVDALYVNDQPVPGTFFPMFPRFAEDGRAAYKAHDGGEAVLVEQGVARRAHALPTVGNWPCCWGPDGSLYLRLLNGNTVEHHRLWPDGRDELLNLSGRDAAEGYHHIEPDGTIVLGNEYAKLNGVIHGIECWDIDIDRFSPYLVAKSNGGLPNGPGAGCIVKIHLLTGDAVMWEAPSDIPHPPRINHGRIAASGPNTPGPNEIDALMVPFKVYAPPAPPRVSGPPVTTDLAFASVPALEPCWVGVCVERPQQPMTPGNCAWSAVDGDTRPVMEAADWARTIEGRTLLCGILGTEWAKTFAAVDKEIAFTKARGGRAIYLHCDSPEHEDFLGQMTTVIRAAGLMPIRGAHAAEDLESLTSQVQRFSKLGPWGITRNFHQGWDGTRYTKDLQRWADCMARATELRRTVPGCEMDWFWGWDRPGGQLQCPPARAYAEAVIAATPTPALLPGVRVQTPVPTPDPPATPPPPPKLHWPRRDASRPPKDEKKDNAGKVAAVVGGAIAALLALLRGKKL